MDDDAGNDAPRLGQLLGCPAGAIEHALIRQNAPDKLCPPLPIGEVLLRLRAITSEQLNDSLRAQRVARLARSRVFAGFADDELGILAEHFHETAARAGEVFITQDTADPYFYLLVSGELAVFRADGDGQETPLAVVGPGESVGEMGFFSGGMRSASVRATSDALLLRARFEDLGDCIERIPRLARTLWDVIAGRLRATNLRYEEDRRRRLAAERSLAHLRDFFDQSQLKELGLGIEGLITRLVHTASSIMDADRATLFLIDPATGELWSKVAQGDEVREIRIPGDAGVAGWAATRAELVNIPDAYRDERFNPAVDRRTGYRTRSILCGPIWGLNDAVVGVVQVINKRSGVFTAEDETLFSAFAHQAGVAVDNFYLYRRMALSHERMATLLDIADSLSSTLDVPGLVSRIVTKMPEGLQCDRSTFFVLDAERDELWSMEAHGTGLKEIRIPAGAGLVGHTLRTGEVLNIADAYRDPRFNRDIDRRTGYRTSSVLCVPVRNRDGAVTGVAQVINKRVGCFDGEDEELLRAICAQIGVALENATLHAHTVEMKNYLQSVQESISNGILTLGPDGTLVTANRAARRILALPEDAGGDIAGLLGRRASVLPRLVAEVQADRAQRVEMDITIDDGAGGTRSANVSVVPLDAGDGGRDGVVVVLEDVTAEKRVKGTLTRYLAQDIVERMLADPGQQALGGVRGRATVLFSDIRAFTALAEAMTAEQTMEFLNQYFERMVDEVFRHRGVLDKFIGDALMAVFGVPYPQADDAVRAVECALGMRRALAAFNAPRVAAGLAPVRFGIGVNTDEVISGNLGSSKRMDYTVIGDGVNVSARLEGLTKLYGTDLLLSEATLADVGGRFPTRRLDRVVLSGRTRPMDVHTVLDEPGAAIEARAARYDAAFAGYADGRFADAARQFEELAADDPAAATLAARCRALAAHPPAQWDGVWRPGKL